MAREISKAESWERVYEAYQNINFTAFDYDTVKSSLVDYIRLYFPENFNDYVESSEFVAILELFSYVAELMAYRIDMAAHENFISTAQRKQSILRLAKLLSYNASRNIPARGLVKIKTVQTTESVYDSRGTNLANKKIIWNDPNNTDWKEQFFLVVNRILQQEFGTVSPSDRVQVDDVVFELYSMNNRSLTNGVISYSAVSSGNTYPMELVPVTLTDSGPQERRPSRSSVFTVLYGSDGLGDSSDTTGFFAYTKQGTLQRQVNTYDGVTPNQITNLEIADINETDVWVNNIDITTGQTKSSNVVDALGRRLGVEGEWVRVDMANVENILFNTNLNRNKFELETLEDDGIRVIFGDGEFADIPAGTFDIWYRQSANEDYIIPKSAVSGNSTSLTYQDVANTTQTFTFSYGLINTLTNASPSETIERVRKSAPSVYYTQDRMVNGRDYNTYMLQDPSILKLRSVNRTYAGDSSYLAWHDPSSRYESVKIFGDDLSIYFRVDEVQLSIENNASIDKVLEALKSRMTDTDTITYHAINGLPMPRRDLYDSERTQITQVYEDTPVGSPFFLLYEEESSNRYIWKAYDEDDLSSTPEDSLHTFEIIRELYSWTLRRRTARVVAESPTTRFWFNNGGTRTVATNTLNSTYDSVVILKANESADHSSILRSDRTFNVIGSEIITTTPNIGQPDITKLHIATLDSDGDGVPDDIPMVGLVDQDVDLTVTTSIQSIPSVTLGVDEFVVEYLDGDDWVEVTNNPTMRHEDEDGVWVTVSYDDQSTLLGKAATAIQLKSNAVHRLRVRNYVYASRSNTQEEFVTVGGSSFEAVKWKTDQLDDNGLWMRYSGRSDLNFAWYHVSPRMNLIDPAPTNIIDTFVIPLGYYTTMKKWVKGETAQPTPPTSLELRTDYGYMLDSKMISDTLILHPGRFKVLFGQHAQSELRANITVVRSSNGTMTDNEVKVSIVDLVRSFFDIEEWEFGETFNFTELSAHIHAKLFSEVKSIVLVPTHDTNSFGDLFQVIPQEDELFLPSISVDNVVIVDYLSPQNIKQ